MSWADLLDIHREFVRPYLKLSTGLKSHSTDFVMRFPFSRFFFRPFLISDAYMALGLWEPYVKKYLATLRLGDVFIDVGAHIGYYTVLASKLVGKVGGVIAIEPDPRNLKLLYMNSINSNNVTILEAGLGIGKFLFLDQKPNPLESSARSLNVDGSIMVQCMGLNELANYINPSSSSQVIIKIDVEGNEINIIKDAGRFIERFSPKLIMECGYPEEVVAAIKDFNYAFRQLFGSYYLFERKQ